MADSTRSQTRKGRISLPKPEKMSEAQKRVYDEVVSGPRGIMVGPLRAVIHSPDLADRWQKLGEYVRYRTVIPEDLKEFAILITARRWNSDLEWSIHRPIAERAGLSKPVIAALRDGGKPALGRPEEMEIYEFVRELQLTGQVSDSAYRPVLDRWGERGIVELTALVGYYTMVAMMLNAHLIPLPEGSAPELEAGAPGMDTLSGLPAGGLAQTAEQDE
jgi:4-carboxymuconolactone decarboxylase